MEIEEAGKYFDGGAAWNRIPDNVERFEVYDREVYAILKSGSVYNVMTIHHNGDVQTIMSLLTSQFRVSSVNRQLIDTVDVQIWAHQFCKRFIGIDEGTMISWFANAMESAKRLGPSQEPLTEKQEEEMLKGYETQADPTEIPGERDVCR